MSIRRKTIEENGRRAVPMEGSRTLTEAVQFFQDLKYSESDTYLVVIRPDEQYNVILFSELREILLKLGPAGLTRPLSNLPIPSASRVVPTDTDESGGDIIDWVASHPQSPVVVTDAGKFTTLFVNPNRSGNSGLVGNLSLGEIHGELVRLSQDLRSDYKSNLPIPTCPHCHQANRYSINDEMQYFCPNCKEIIT